MQTFWLNLLWNSKQWIFQYFSIFSLKKLFFITSFEFNMTFLDALDSKTYFFSGFGFKHLKTNQNQEDLESKTPMFYYFEPYSKRRITQPQTIQKRIQIWRISNLKHLFVTVLSRTFKKTHYFTISIQPQTCVCTSHSLNLFRLIN